MLNWKKFLYISNGSSGKGDANLQTESGAKNASNINVPVEFFSNLKPVSINNLKEYMTSAKKSNLTWLYIVLIVILIILILGGGYYFFFIRNSNTLKLNKFKFK